VSVYTVVEPTSLASFLATRDAGTLLDYSGISDGIENTNYLVATTRGDYVLTLFESTPEVELPYFLDLMAHLSAHGVPSARPLTDRDGRYLGLLCARPAALVERLPGRSVTVPDLAHCRAVGAALARLHLAGRSFAPTRATRRGAHWRAATFAQVRSRLPASEVELLLRAVAEFESDRFTDLPSGVIHADLFRDNVLFEGEELTGIIDFYYAHTGAWLYDLAVAVADWCFDKGHAFDAARTRALLAAYASVRTLEARERAAWSIAVQAAGLRFWLSRLKDALYPRGGALTRIKDPEPFKRVYLFGREHPAVLAQVLP
jgi:homoserine kinase type II